MKGGDDERRERVRKGEAVGGRGRDVERAWRL